MRDTFFKLLATALLGLLTTATAQAAAVYITRDTNLRAGPGVGYRALLELKAGEPVDKGDCTPDGSWCYVRHGATGGWAASVFLGEQAPNTAQPGLQPAANLFTTTAGLNVRSGPGVGNDKVGTIEAGETVTRGQCSGTWCQISGANVSGWVSNNFLEPVEGSPDTAAQAPAPETAAPSATPPSAPAPTQPDDQTYIATTDLNVRSGPGSGYDVLDALTKDQKVVRLQCTDSGSWCQVRAGTLEGWVFARYLEPSTAEPAAAQPAAAAQQSPQANQTGTAVTGMTVRETPSLFAGIVGRLDRGVTVPVDRCTSEGGWCHILGSQPGWVPAPFLELKQLPQGGAVAHPNAVTAEQTPLRQGPGQTYPVLGLVAPGTHVHIDKCNFGGDWCQITQASQSGWIEAGTLQVPDEVLGNPATPHAQTVCFTGFGGERLCVGE